MFVSDVVRLMRPRQWVKNLAVFAAIIFAQHLFYPNDLARTMVAFVVLCMVASGLYAINDAVDAVRDREHPVKCERPVAAGRISVGTAVAIGIALCASGLAIAYLLGWPLVAVTAGFLLLHIAYSLWLKSIAIVDILVIALGFVLRAVAGAVVISVVVSPWLVLCTGLLALFIASGKRRHEVLLLRGRSVEHRPALSAYSAELLDSFMVTLSAATVTSYAIYTFFEVRGPQHAMMLTIPFVIYGVLRYQMLVLTKQGGGQPEEIMLKDKPMIADLVLWVASAVVVLYALPRFVH